MAPTSSLGPLQPITRGVEVDSQRDVIRRTEFWEDVHYSKLIGTGEKTEEEKFDEETKKRKVDIEQEVDQVIYEEFIKFIQEAAIEDQILKLTQRGQNIS